MNKGKAVHHQYFFPSYAHDGFHIDMRRYKAVHH